MVDREAGKLPKVDFTNSIERQLCPLFQRPDHLLSLLIALLPVIVI